MLCQRDHGCCTEPRLTGLLQRLISECVSGKESVFDAIEKFMGGGGDHHTWNFVESGTRSPRAQAKVWPAGGSLSDELLDKHLTHHGQGVSA